MGRYECLEDYFVIKCRNCKSTNIDLSVEECSICGTSISAYCNNCGSNYDPHEFKWIKKECIK